MTDATAACWGAPSFDASFNLRHDRLRLARLVGTTFVGLGTAAVSCLPLVAVAIAGWMMTAPHGAIPHPDMRMPKGPMFAAAVASHPVPAERAVSSGITTIAKTPAQAKPPEAPEIAQRSFESRWADAFGPAAVRHTVASVAYDTPVIPTAVPLPRAHPVSDAQESAKPEAAPSPATGAAPKVASAVEVPAPAPHAVEKIATEKSETEKSASVKEAHNRSTALPSRDSRTAVYDISARTVYMPNGDRLEAHSGLGEKMDNPRYVHVRMRGPTPPNVYELTLREQLFHGVRAIRLNPVNENKMFGRDGMLAHTYMLGPNGQSNGCVSFKDYSKFLRAYLNGEVTRLVVVPRLGDMPLSVARNGGDDGRYASAEPPAPASPLTW